MGNNRTLELTLISAKDLKNVNLIGKMDVYVIVYLSNDPKSKQKTPVHQDGGTNPSWNYTMRFTIDDAAPSGKYLIFQLRHEHSFGADKDLGEVRVSLKELIDSFNGKDDPSSPLFLTYQVKTSSGKAKGELKFSYKFADNKPSQSSSGVGSSSGGYAVYPPPGPVAQPYPPPPPRGYPDGGSVYPPSQQAHARYPPQVGLPYAGPAMGHPLYGGSPPPPAGYGYPPAPGGYPAYPPAGYPQTQKPKKKKNNFGMGLGAGLIGGAVGGLVLGEMVDDAFDDCGGFDF